MRRQAYGFTIVELLIVIVVIAILAAISIVAYNGVSNSANDSAIKSDLTNMAKKIHMDAADRGSYIQGGSAAGNSANFPGFVFGVSKDAYMTESGTNLFYCTGLDGSGNTVFRVDGRSKSGQSFRYDSSQGLVELGSVGMSSTRTCSDLSSTSFSYGYYRTLGWYSWTNG